MRFPYLPWYTHIYIKSTIGSVRLNIFEKKKKKKKRFLTNKTQFKIETDNPNKDVWDNDFINKKYDFKPNCKKMIV
jgi:hypothetical protein